jgi:hypothetical protein
LAESHVALLSRFFMEMIFRMRAEIFDPLADRVFHCVGDDGRGSGITRCGPEKINGLQSLAMTSDIDIWRSAQGFDDVAPLCTWQRCSGPR